MKNSKEQFIQYRTKREAAHGISAQTSAVDAHYAPLRDEYASQLAEIEEHRLAIRKIADGIVQSVVNKYLPKE